MKYNTTNVPDGVYILVKTMALGEIFQTWADSFLLSSCVQIMFIMGNILI